MAEISVQFSNNINGYNKVEVNEYVKQAESKLQEKSIALANAQQQVEELEARLNKITSADYTFEEKVELYDKLMKKMDGDYTNLLAPAIAKAKAIEAQAEKEYAIRMDQARYAAEGIYTETADRIAGVVDSNMDRLYNLLDEFIYSKTIPGRFKAFVKNCKAVAATITEAPKKAVVKVKETVMTTVNKFTSKKAVAEEEAVEEVAAEAAAE